MRALKEIKGLVVIIVRDEQSKKGGRRKTVNRIRQVRWEHIDKRDEIRKKRDKKDKEKENKKVRTRGIEPLTG